MFAMSLRGWLRARAEKMEAEPLPLLIVKNLMFAAIIIGIAYNLALYKGLPVILVIMAAAGAVLRVRDDAHGDRAAHLCARRQPAGRAAFGRQDRAADLPDLRQHGPVGRASPGLVVAARLNSSTPSAGNSFELDVIAACFIGGVSASGGVGKVMNVVIGALFMGVMNNGMSLIGLGIFWQQVVKGLVLLAAVGVDVYQKSKG